MGCGFFQRCRIRQGGVFRIVNARRPGIVPQFQHAAHGNVDFSIGQGVVLLALQQQIHNPLVYRHRGNARLIVDGFQVGNAFVIVIDVEQLVIFQQLVMDCLGLLLKCFLRFGIPQNGGHRIKQGQKCGLVLGWPLRLGGGCTACQQAGKTHKANQDSPHNFTFR